MEKGNDEEKEFDNVFKYYEKTIEGWDPIIKNELEKNDC